MKRHLMLAAAVAGLLVATPALAQTDATPAASGQAAVEQMSKVTAAQDFVTFAAMSDLFEVKAGELAGKQGASKPVKAFGKMLVKDHSKSSKQLMQLAKSAKLDVTAPDQLDARHQAILDRLGSARGAAFDTAFAQAQVDAHQEGIALFTSYSENGDTPQLKTFAKKGLPVLQKHLATAQKLAGAPPTQ